MKPRWRDPHDRINLPRDMALCGECRHYKPCITAGAYCPPYSLAVRDLVAKDGVSYAATSDAILEEIKLAKDAGWTAEDFCIICNHRCKLKEGAKAAPDFYFTLETRLCRALAHILMHLPCPTKTARKTAPETTDPLHDEHGRRADPGAPASSNTVKSNK